jgi:micrococcal nuclease
MKAFAWTVLMILAASPAAAEILTGMVEQVQTGDRLVVNVGGSPVKVRLHGVVCPPVEHPVGAKARQAATKLAQGKPVSLLVVERKGGEVAASVIIGPVNLGHELVRGGHGWCDPAVNNAALSRMEATASRAKAGVWSDPSAVPPWKTPVVAAKPEAPAPAQAKPVPTESPVMITKLNSDFKSWGSTPEIQQRERQRQAAAQARAIREQMAYAASLARERIIRTDHVVEQPIDIKPQPPIQVTLPDPTFGGEIPLRVQIVR